MGSAQAAAKILWNLLVASLPAGHHDDVGMLDHFDAVVRRQGEAPMRAQRAVLDRATGEAIPSIAHLGPGQAEHLRHNPELEGAQALVEQRDSEGS